MDGPQSQYQDSLENDKMEIYARVVLDKKFEYNITGRSRQPLNFSKFILHL